MILSKPKIKKSRKKNKSKRSSHIILFFVFFFVCLVGLISLIFGREMREFLSENFNSRGCKNITKNLIESDAKIYDHKTSKKPEYPEEDRDYLEKKIINKN